jgi:hypothetical protein
VLRTYTLTDGSRMFIDTGVYPDDRSGGGVGQHRPRFGLGLDEGFLMTGPTNPVLRAELFPAIAGDRSRP